MAKHNRPSHSVQPTPHAPPKPDEDKPTGPETAPSWGWTAALLVWALCFGGLVVYELWTGVLSNFLRR